jgi:hypothetical protein
MRMGFVILVVGGLGFLGSITCQGLTSGYNVRDGACYSLELCVNHHCLSVFIRMCGLVAFTHDLELDVKRFSYTHPHNVYSQHFLLSSSKPFIKSFPRTK